jgi:hypothetical protein
VIVAAHRRSGSETNQFISETFWPQFWPKFWHFRDVKVFGQIRQNIFPPFSLPVPAATGLKPTTLGWWVEGSTTVLLLLANLFRLSDIWLKCFLVKMTFGQNDIWSK